MVKSLSHGVTAHCRSPLLFARPFRNPKSNGCLLLRIERDTIERRDAFVDFAFGFSCLLGGRGGSSRRQFRLQRLFLCEATNAENAEAYYLAFRINAFHQRIMGRLYHRTRRFFELHLKIVAS